MRQFGFLIWIVCLVSLLMAHSSVFAAPLGCKNCVTSRQIKNRSVKRKDLARSAVDTDQLADAAVTEDKLASDIKERLVKTSATLTLGPSAFHQDRDNECGFEFEGYWAVAPGQNCCLHAQLDLPDASTISELTGIYLDIDAGVGEGFEIDLNKLNLGSFENTTQVSTIMSDNDPDVQTVTVTDIGQLVDAENESYFIGLCFSGDNNRFYGARVKYQ